MQLEWHWKTGPNSNCNLFHGAMSDVTVVSYGGLHYILAKYPL